MMAENNVIVRKKPKMKVSKPPALYFAVRIRGAPGMKRTILDTLKMLRMHKVNHGVLIWGDISYLGMLQKCKEAGACSEETQIYAQENFISFLINDPDGNLFEIIQSKD